MSRRDELVDVALAADAAHMPRINRGNGLVELCSCGATVPLGESFERHSLAAVVQAVLDALGGDQ